MLHNSTSFLIPTNNCWCHEKAYPDVYGEIRNGYLAHIYIKDIQVKPQGFSGSQADGKKQLADQFHAMAGALRIDLYEGVVSFESVYHPGKGDYEAGFRLNIEKFINFFN